MDAPPEHVIPPDALVAWCRTHLGSEPERTLFERQSISAVVGVHLADGRDVVVKARTAEDRVRSCFLVQRHLWAAGFPCPEPLAGPAPLDARVATAEAYITGGAPLARTASAPRKYGDGLARLVQLARTADNVPTLDPVPYWVHWDHALAGIWPPDPDVDLNAYGGPAWLDDLGDRARRRLLRASRLPDVIGHADWESQNLRWSDDEILVSHDWDSLVRRPEATIAGIASLMFPSTGTTNEAATIAESQMFLDAYEARRGRAFSVEERELAWAAGLWIGAWKAKKTLACNNPTAAVDDLFAQAQERLRRSAS